MPQPDPPETEPARTAGPAERAAQAAQAAIDRVHADPRQARALATRALGLARRERDPAARSMAYRALGLAAHSLNDLDGALGLAAHELGDLAAALTALHAAVRVADSAGLAAPAGQARMSRAFVLLSQGRTGAALRDAEARRTGQPN